MNSQNSELPETHVKDDLKNHFKDNQPFSKKHLPSTKKMWEIMLRLDGPTCAVLC